MGTSSGTSEEACQRGEAGFAEEQAFDGEAAAAQQGFQRDLTFDDEPAAMRVRKIALANCRIGGDTRVICARNRDCFFQPVIFFMSGTEGAVHMTDTKDIPPYAGMEPPRKSRRIWWISGIVIVVLILLGTCVKGGVDLFQAVSARQQATSDLARQFLSGQAPEAEDPIFSKRANVTPEALAQLQTLMDQFGPVSDYSDAVCTLTTAANTNKDASGTFGECQMTAVSKHSPVVVYVRWCSKARPEGSRLQSELHRQFHTHGEGAAVRSGEERSGRDARGRVAGLGLTPRPAGPVPWRGASSSSAASRRRALQSGGCVRG